MILFQKRITHLRASCAALLLGALGLTTLHAQQPALNLVAPSTPAVPGKIAAVDLVALNPADYGIAFTAPKTMAGELAVNGAAPVTVQLRITSIDADDNDLDSIQARGFQAYSYAFELPASAQKGDAVLTVRQPALMRMVIAIDPDAPVIVATQTPDALNATGTTKTNHEKLQNGEITSLTAQLEPQPVVQKVKRGFIENFAVYEPMYFIMGFDEPAAKFQFSFQYQMLANEGWIARNISFLKGLRFAYTQRSLWDITSDSSPFYDTSYMPEIFLSSTSTSRKKWGWFTWLGVQGGIGHESNGRGGDDSRSMNKLFARGSFAIGNIDGWRLIVTPKVWTYLGDMSDNDDLNDYRGYGELQLAFGKNDSLNISVLARGGQHFKYGAVQVDATYPVDVLFKNFAAYFLVQYWNGYGESLLNYNQRTETVRFGLSIVR